MKDQVCLKSGHWPTLLAAAGLASAITLSPARADDPPTAASAANPPAPSLVPQAAAPLGVFGVDMPGAGKFVISNFDSYSRLGGNMIGAQSVAPLYIIDNVYSPDTPNGLAKLHMVPHNLQTYSEGLSAAYGVTENFSLSVATAYLEKSVDMETFAAKSTSILGDSTGRTDGFGDTQVAGVWRVYRDNVNQFNLNFGLSLPTGGATNTEVLLLPSGLNPVKRAFYGMQEGSGTFDALPGVAYSGVLGPWSWGLAYRGRIPLGDNPQGWRFGDYHQIDGWGGYSWAPGLETTLRLSGSTQTAIHGFDPAITGFAQGADPMDYGGQHVDLFGGAMVNGRYVGLPAAATLGLEAGAPLYQNLNGPQLARDWQIASTLRYKF